MEIESIDRCEKPRISFVISGCNQRKKLRRSNPSKLKHFELTICDDSMNDGPLGVSIINFTRQISPQLDKPERGIRLSNSDSRWIRASMMIMN